MHILLFIVAVLNLGLGVLVWKKDYKKPRNYLFFIFTIAVFIWLFGLGLDYYLIQVNRIYPPEILLYIDRVLFAAAYLIPLPIFLFSFCFLSDKKISRAILYPSIIVGLVSMVAGYFIPISINKDYIFNFANFEYCLSFLMVSATIFLILKIALEIRKQDKIAKFKGKLFLIGLSIAFVTSILSNSIFPSIFKNLEFIYVGPLVAIFIVIFTSYSILKYRFMDIRIALKKGIVVISLLVLFAMMILLAGLGASRIFEIGFNFNTGVVIFLTLSCKPKGLMRSDSSGNLSPINLTSSPVSSFTSRNVADSGFSLSSICPPGANHLLSFLWCTNKNFLSPGL